MELNRDGRNRELKLHGTYGFPVYAGRKWISSYPTGSFPWHWHEEVEFTLVAAGRMDYRVNDSRYLLKAGEGLFCNSSALHSGSMGDVDCDYVSLTFHPRLLSGFEGSAIGGEFVQPVVESRSLASLKLTAGAPWQREILYRLWEVYRLLLEKPLLYQLEIQRQLLAAWAKLYANCAQRARSAPEADQEKLRRLRVILTYVQEKYAEKLALEDVAQQVGLCKSECCRFFKRQMGSSLFDYILDYRVGKSLSHLKAGRSVGEAAAAVGFSDASYFAKAFRERTGRSPSEYRRENMQKNEHVQNGKYMRKDSQEG